MRLLPLVFVGLFAAGQSAADIVLGVLAPQGPERALERWQPFADALSEDLGEEVRLFPLNASDGVDAFVGGHMDLLLGNPVQTAVVVDTLGAVPVASMTTRAGAEFAGVIAVAQDGPIATLADLSGRRIATLGDWAAGGFLFQADHLMTAGLPHPAELGERIVRPDQDALVGMVLAGEADAAFIRTGVIEDLVSRGVLAEGQLRVLDEQAVTETDLHRSTRWYPEWFMVAQAGLDPTLRDSLRDVLLGMTGADPALGQARVTGFVAPIDVAPVVAAMKRVGVAPYN
jgi:ABC-type phosphate/phosphonate transport system substrate-binding protein